MEKSVLELIGGEKHINPHYDIKAESTSCYPVSKGFTGVEINGVRFSNIGEMLQYMDKQREQLEKAKEILQKVITDFHNRDCVSVHIDKTIAKAEQFLKEN